MVYSRLSSFLEKKIVSKKGRFGSSDLDGGVIGGIAKVVGHL